MVLNILFCPTKIQGANKVMVWASGGDRIIGPFFVYGNFNGDKYITIFLEEIFPSLLYEDGNFPAYFQQDGVALYFGFHVHQWLDQQFWVRGLVGVVLQSGPPDSRNLYHLIFAFGGI